MMGNGWTHVNRGASARDVIASLRNVAIHFPAGRRLQAVIDAYAGLVPSDAWAFSYRRRDAVVGEFLSGDPHIVPERLRMVRAEIAAHRNAAPAAPVASPATRTEPYRHGLTVHLEDPRGGEGALLLLRDAHSGEFLVDDHCVLSEAREEVLRAIDTQAHFDGELTDLERARSRSAPGIILLDETLSVEYVSKQQRARRTDRFTCSGGRLPIAIEHAVRQLTSFWKDPAARIETAFMPSPELIVRVVPLERGRHYAIALVLEPFQGRSPLADAVRRFRLTNRELEVIALLFSGLGTPGVAKRLSISATTVNDHVKRLLAKTNCVNRTEMAATLLGWRGPERLDDA
ncbi:MAG: helix-turn-helix domain-containing protein [Candidatus Tyrphobacter sp.]